MFERFTEPARAVVAAATYEAANRRHRSLGTEHLLLGLLADHANRPHRADRPDGLDERAAAPLSDAASRVLAAVGIDSEYVHSEIVRLVGPGSGGLGEPEAEALRSIGIDLDDVRSKVEAAFGEGVLDQLSRNRSGRRLPWTPRARHVLGLALGEARGLQHSHLGPEHILLGLIREADGTAGRILAARVSLDSLRDRVLAELDQAA